MHGFLRGCLTWCSDLQGFSYLRCGSLQMPAFICANMLILAASWRHIYPCLPSSIHVFYLRPHVVWWFAELGHSKCHLVCTESEKETFSTTTPVSTCRPSRSDGHEVHDIRHNFGTLHATTYSLLRAMLGGINWGILCILAMFAMLCRAIYELMLQQCILKMKILLVTQMRLNNLFKHASGDMLLKMDTISPMQLGGTIQLCWISGCNDLWVGWVGSESRLFIFYVLFTMLVPWQHLEVGNG